MEKTQNKSAFGKKRKISSRKTSKKVSKIGELLLPTSIFLDRSLSVLETISEYLKEKKNLTYHEIAVLLNRDDRTIWTCYHRAKTKRSETK